VHAQPRGARVSAHPGCPDQPHALRATVALAPPHTGVGSFGVCMDNLHKKGYYEPLKVT
jgi:hypothetical protein